MTLWVCITFILPSWFCSPGAQNPPGALPLLCKSRLLLSELTCHPGIAHFEALCNHQKKKKKKFEGTLSAPKGCVWLTSDHLEGIRIELCMQMLSSGPPALGKFPGTAGKASLTAGQASGPRGAPPNTSTPGPPGPPRRLVGGRAGGGETGQASVLGHPCGHSCWERK